MDNKTRSKVIFMVELMILFWVFFGFWFAISIVGVCFALSEGVDHIVEATENSHKEH